MTVDCRHCGACCRSAFASVQISEDDVIKFVYPNALEIKNGKIFLRRVADRCVALIQSSDGRCSCGVYEHRPSVCREFVAGSPQCLDARRRTGVM